MRGGWKLETVDLNINSIITSVFSSKIKRAGFGLNEFYMAFYSVTPMQCELLKSVELIENNSA